jgi:endonuclease VIII
VPEGDTVWLTAQRLHQALAGELLTGTDFRVPELATVDLTGRIVVGTLSRGKHLLTRIEGGLTLHTHLRMDGAWRLYRRGERWRGGPTWQIRLRLSTAAQDAIGYRLPVVELVRSTEEARVVGHLGPDLLGSDWDLDEALRRLRAEPGRELGQALLDQRNLAGIGNLYKAEACFLAGVSPWTPVRDVPDLEAVVREAHRLLERNKADWPQVTTGDPRPGMWHWVFERTGRPCRRCGARVLMAEQGRAPQGRMTYWCAHCQPGPAPSALPPGALPPSALPASALPPGAHPQHAPQRSRRSAP